MAAGTLLVKNSYVLVVLRSLLFSLSIVIGGLAISLGTAMLANQKIRGIRIYRTLLIWPYAISPAIIGVIFLFMFNPVVGRDQLRLGGDFSHPPQLAG